MTSEERIRRQKELVEALGRLYDKKGFQPVAGRICKISLKVYHQKSIKVYH